MKLTNSAIYALRAVFLISENEFDKPVSCRQLASDGEMPERFLLQILRNLVANGILRSVRGVIGGYLMKSQPDQLTVLEVIEAASGPIESQNLTEKVPNCSFTKKLQHLLEEISAQQRGELGAVTIADLMGAESGE